MPKRILLAAVAAAVLLAATPVAAEGWDWGRTGDTCRVPRALDWWGILLVSQERSFFSDPRGFLRAWRETRERLRSHFRVEHCTSLNEIQVLGTHNSYHIQPEPILFDIIELVVGDLALEIEYTHRPLDEQLDLGIRQFELDVFADPEGGLYQDPLGPRGLGLPNRIIPELDAPGVKVLHIQDIDFESTCWTLVECMETVKAWSDAHPRHLPIVIMIEFKTGPLPIPFDLGWVVPLPIDNEFLDDVDAEIRSVFPPEQLITPDDVRGVRTTLEEAVLEDGWPTLGRARGKVMFLMDNGGGTRALYREGRPSLDGRPLFTNAVPGDADAAFVKVNDPFAGGDTSLIADLVSNGYIVRTRADTPTSEARSGDTTRRDAALASGAQYVSTDYPEESPFGSGYIVELPDGPPARCNPVNAPEHCRNELLSGVD